MPIPGGEPLHKGFHTINYRVADDLTAAVFVPDYELSTEKARQALPGPAGVQGCRAQCVSA